MGTCIRLKDWKPGGLPSGPTFPPLIEWWSCGDFKQLIALAGLKSNVGTDLSIYQVNALGKSLPPGWGKDRMGVNPPHLNPLPPGERKLPIKSVVY